MQSWHEEELVSFAWRWTTTAHADPIISARHSHAMGLETDRMNSQPYERSFQSTPKFCGGLIERGYYPNSASPPKL